MRSRALQGLRQLLFSLAALGLVLLAGSSFIQGQDQPEVDYWIPDDFPTIQEAIDSVPEGSAIGIRAGTYEENLLIEKAIRLVGVGAEATVIQAVEEGYPVVRITGEEAIEVGLEGLTVRGGFGACAERGICPYGLLIQGKAQVSLEGIAVTGSESHGLVIMDEAQVSLVDSQIFDNRRAGIRFECSSKITEMAMRNSRVFDNYTGIAVVSDSQVTVEDSEVSGNDFLGFDVKGLGPANKVEIRRTRIVDNGGCGINVFGNLGRVTGSDNEMHGNGADLCGYAPPELRRPLVPQTERAELTVPGDYATVQEAIDALAPGGVITLAEGTYQEGLTLWKPLTLKGAGRERMILRALPERSLVMSIPAGVSVKLEGLQITGSDRNGLLITGQAELMDVQVSGNAWSGLVVWSFEEWDSTPQVILKDSWITDNGSSGVASNWSSWIMLWNTTISGNGTNGVLGAYGVRLAAEGSRISGNGESGLVASSWGQATIQNTVIEGNGTRPWCGQNKLCNGIEVSGKFHVEVTGSVIRANTDWGISAWLKKCGYDRDDFEGEVILEDNEIGDNGRGEVCLSELCIPEDAC